MLKLLVDYAIAKGLEAEPGFATKAARWAIRFDQRGRYLGVIELRKVDEKNNRGRKFAKCPDLSQPEMKAGGITMSHFLVDAAEVVALFGKNADDAKVIAKHAHFVNLLREAASDMPVLATLADWVANETTLAGIRSDLQGQATR